MRKENSKKKAQQHEQFDSLNISYKDTTDTMNDCARLTDMMNDWSRLIEQQKNNEDVWTVIPELPQYKFKNLQIKTCTFDENTNEMSYTFKYDEFKNIE